MLLKNEVALAGIKNISVLSAGIFVYPGNPPDPKMVDYLSKMGITTADHHARQISKKDIEWADLILVMEKDHAIRLKNKWPDAEAKVERLGNLISQDQNVDDIIDPFGRSPYHYRLAQSQIILATKSLVRRLISGQEVIENAENQIHSS